MRRQFVDIARRADHDDLVDQSPLPLVRARALTCFAELVTDLGGDAEALLGGVGMTVEMLAQPEATISMPGTVALLENAASQLDAPDFGLMLAQRQDFSVSPHRIGCQPCRHGGYCACFDGAQFALSRGAHLASGLTRSPLEGRIWLRYELPPEAGKLEQVQTSRSRCAACWRSDIANLSGETGSDWQVVLAHKPGVECFALSKFLRLQGRLPALRPRRNFSGGHSATPSRWRQPADSRGCRALRGASDPTVSGLTSPARSRN